MKGDFGMEQSLETGTITVTFLPTAEDVADFAQARFLCGAGRMPAVFRNIGLYIAQRDALMQYQQRPPFACTASFSPAGVSLETERYKARLPWRKLCGCKLTEKVLLLYTGVQEVRFVPARTLSAKQQQAVLQFYHDANSVVQEDAH